MRIFWIRVTADINATCLIIQLRNLNLTLSKNWSISRETSFKWQLLIRAQVSHSYVKLVTDRWEIFPCVYTWCSLRVRNKVPDLLNQSNLSFSPWSFVTIAAANGCRNYFSAATLGQISAINYPARANLSERGVWHLAGDIPSSNRLRWNSRATDGLIAR